MPRKNWNWKHKNWPNFSFETEILNDLEHQFSINSGIVVGVLKHLEDVSKDDFVVDLLCNEALKTSEIEGEYLDRDSVQSSIKRNLGLTLDKRKVPPAEYGISEMMVDLYLNYENPLTHELLFEWHKMLTHGRRDITDIGKYRTHEDPMQVVSGRIDKPNVHFEAPPSKDVPKEMNAFIQWFNKVHFNDSDLTPLVKSGITHLYFVSIHPFEDGNGRIARALAEKSIALSLQKPSLISLAQTIEMRKKDYYNALEENNTSLEITDWLTYFAHTIVDAQQNTLKQLDFLIEKTKFFDRFINQLNDRQWVVVLRLFEAGISGFKGGLSADNYVKIAKTSASTATRDLQDLVEKKALKKTGTLKSTRYYLNIN